MITRTHNAYHLGDNLTHLHFLRKVALANPDRQFVHSAENRYHRQLRPVISDVLNIRLEDYYGHVTPPNSINAWRGENRFWYEHPGRNDFVKFHIEAWFPQLCDRMQVENPMRTAADMLFDYPAIQNPIKDGTDGKSFDVLVINSPPFSGQFQAYNYVQLGDIVGKMIAKGLSVKTSGTGMPHIFYSATEIGHLSLHCHTILMISTGPSWPTFNIWNQDSIKNRIILLDSERVYLAPNTIHCSRIEEAAEVLKESGLL